MNRYPNWLNWLVLFVVVAGAIVALPNVFGDDPAVHVARGDGESVVDAIVPEIRATLNNADINFVGININDGAAVIRFEDVSEQLRANDLLSEQMTP
jgi:preprotein translocase subunit SecD